MTWTDIRNNWQDALTDLKIRFPLVDHNTVKSPPDSLSALTNHVATRHDLTAYEAEEEITDWMFVVSLARVATAVSPDLSDQ